MQFTVQITVPSTFVVYIQKLLEAGLISIDKHGKPAMSKALREKLEEVHATIGAGDRAITNDLTVLLDRALAGGGATISSI